ncbi:hypothetical protein K493DRAFT_380351 [Basidiobolus meristosporus CBS 931.73]|uniref:Uncharacterized protein n=1 Tax=Basidiobolus meristosporus CBS 931.73 TaxID=1314790 RepID=A0A1Y1Z1N8_9FUNG|nr:hypothetical protein K493DRAFT_380351 [Basidiobolus meristosporus CBS 931.73]|eukprot:ORY04202.1 hypothetical protein K493DRAFT_380351 [Basidiobolus meristosporus CBS 931.73]
MPPASATNKTCSLTDSFALIIQGILALISLSTLMIKRHRESPRRPLLVWFYDTSKQAFAAAFIHLINIIAAYTTTQTNPTLNPCEWYFLSILIDTTIGVATLFVLLSVSNALICRFEMRSLYSGQYGDPPKMSVWLKQLFLFITIASINKALLVLLFLIPYILLLAHYLSRHLLVIQGCK